MIHASSFSKSVSPGVRVGYLVGPAEQIATLAKRANETYISPNMLAESIVFELCRSGGLDENLEGRERGAARAARRAGRGAARAHPRGRVRRARGRLLPLARPERRRRHQGPARRGEGGGRHLRRGPRLHDRGRRLEPAALLRAGARPDRSPRASSGSRARWSALRAGGPAPRPPRACSPEDLAGLAGRGSGPRRASDRACASARCGVPRSPWRSTTSLRSARFRSVIRMSRGACFHSLSPVC